MTGRSARLGPGEKLICAACIAVMNDALDQYVVTIRPEDLAAAEDSEVTSEQAYEQAQSAEVRWETDDEGTLTPESAADPTRGRA